MKKAIAFSILILIAAYFCSCEKDDLCAEGTPTTPSVVIEFYQSTNRTVPQNVTNLKVIADGMDVGLPLGGASIETFTGNTIKVPLRVDGNTTAYQFIINATATDGSLNSDKLTFSYTRNEIYVSRACGYKTLFTLNDNSGDDGEDEEPGVALTDTDGTAWILGFGVEKLNIDDENEAHIKIYF